MKYETFEKRHPKGSEGLKGLNPEFVYENYHKHIKPYIAMIESFLAREDRPSDKVLKSALGISSRLWNASAECFEEFGLAVSLPEEYMEIKAQIDLQKGLEGTEYKNPKILEMQLQRYDKGYKKNAEVEVELPTTLKVEILDKSLGDEELKEHEPEL